MNNSLYESILRIIMKQTNSVSPSSITIDNSIPYTPVNKDDDPDIPKNDNGDLKDIDWSNPFSIPEFQEFNYQLIYDDDENLIAFTSRSGLFTYTLVKDKFDDLVEVTVDVTKIKFRICLIFEKYDVRAKDPQVEDKGKLIEVVILSMDGENFIKSLKIQPTRLTVAVGETAQYSAFAVMHDGSEVDVTKSVIWNVSKPLSVKTGLVSNTQTGVYTVSANYQNLQATAQLEVLPMELLIQPDSIKIDLNQLASYKAFKKNRTGSWDEITNYGTWSIGAPLSINNGDVTNTTQYGVYTVTFNYKGNTKTADLEVVKPELEITPTSQIIAKGDYGYVQVYLKSLNNTINVTSYVNWTNAGGLVITDDGTISNTDITPGTYQISADYNGFKDTATVEIKDFELYLEPSSLIVAKSYPASFKCKKKDANGKVVDVTSLSDWTIETPYTINKGVVSGTNNVGSAVVTATYQGKTARGTLIVNDWKLVINPGSDTINYNENTLFRAYLQTGVDNIDVSSSSDWSINSSTIYISNGYVSNTVEIGTFVITAKYDGFEATATLTIKDSQLIVTPDSDTINKGETASFKAYLNGEEVTDFCSWSVGSPLNINRGVVTNTNTTGEFLITATYNGKQGTATLKINDVQLIVVPSEVAVELGQTAQFRAVLKGGDGSETDVTSSSTWKINCSFSISQGNVWNINALGNYTVTATYNGLSATGILHVAEKTVPISTSTINIQMRDDSQIDGDGVFLTVNGEYQGYFSLVSDWISKQVELKTGNNEIKLTAWKNGVGSLSCSIRVTDTSGKVLQDSLKLWITCPSGTFTYPNNYYKIWNFVVS